MKKFPLGMRTAILLTGATLTVAGSSISLAAAPSMDPVYAFPAGSAQNAYGVHYGLDGKLYGIFARISGASPSVWGIDPAISPSVYEPLWSDTFPLQLGPEPFPSGTTMGFGNLARSSYGDLYGIHHPSSTTCALFRVEPVEGGGTVERTYYGAIFRISPDNPAPRIVAPLREEDNIIRCPTGLIAMDDSDNLYVLDRGNGQGAVEGDGALFRVSRDESGNYEFVLLKAFNSADTGRMPLSVFANEEEDGVWLYGLNAQGGSGNKGTVYKVKSTGEDFQVLHHFPATEPSAFLTTTPVSSLVVVEDHVYVTSGGGVNSRIFRLRKDGSSNPVVLIQTNNGFNDGGQRIGGNPTGPMVVAEDGNIYAVNTAGGDGGAGTLFRVVVPSIVINEETGEVTNSGFELLQTFDPAREGRNPKGLSQGMDGKLYGVTWTGTGEAVAGTVFAVNTGYVPPYPRITSFSASPAELVWDTPPLSTTLSWKTSDATACEADSDNASWMGAVTTEGSQDISIIENGAHEFTLTCWKGEVRSEENSQSQTIRVSASEVPEPPQVDLTVTPTTVIVDQEITIAWEVVGATNCTTAGPAGWTGSLSVEELTAGNGNRVISITGNPGSRTISLTCDNQGIPAETVSVELTVTAAPIPPEDEIDASSGGGALSPTLLLLLMLTGMARYAAWTPRRQRV